MPKNDAGASSDKQGRAILGLPIVPRIFGPVREGARVVGTLLSFFVCTDANQRDRVGSQLKAIDRPIGEYASTIQAHVQPAPIPVPWNLVMFLLQSWLRIRYAVYGGLIVTEKC